MKILLVNVPAVEEHSKSGQFVKKVLVPLWRRNFDLVKPPDMQLTFRFAEKGVTSDDFADCKHLMFLNEAAMYDAVIQGEADGFDAAVITCFSDYRLWEAREAVNIPVVSIAEASMLTAAAMGLKFGVVTLSEFEIRATQKLVDLYGLNSRSVPTLAMDGNPADQEGAIENACKTIAAFKVISKKMIANGADILIPGCGLTSPALRLAPGAEKEYPNGLTQVDGVPVADVFSEALLMAQSLVSLKNSGSAWINCKGFHINKIDEKPLDSGYGRFWDC